MRDLVERARKLFEDHEVHQNLSVIILAIPIDEVQNWKQDANTKLIEVSESANNISEK